jgi:hypothetical protein
MLLQELDILIGKLSMSSAKLIKLMLKRGGPHALSPALLQKCNHLLLQVV